MSNTTARNGLKDRSHLNSVSGKVESVTSTRHCKVTKRYQIWVRTSKRRERHATCGKYNSGGKSEKKEKAQRNELKVPSLEASGRH